MKSQQYLFKRNRWGREFTVNLIAVVLVVASSAEAEESRAIKPVKTQTEWQ